MAAAPKEQLADLKREMGDAGQINPVADRATETATAALDSAQEYAARLANIIRQQPLVALAVGMAIAYVVGRTVTLLGTTRKRTYRSATVGPRDRKPPRRR